MKHPLLLGSVSPRPLHPPKLGIDASRSTRSCPTGVERYSSEILRALLPELEGFEVRLYTPKVIEGFPRKLQKILWFPRLWSLVRLSWEMLWHKPDLLFVPAHVLPFFAPKRSFVTVHDVAFRKIPSAYGWRARWYLNWSTRRAVRKCEMIFVPSEAVAVDLLKFYGAKRVTVVPHGPLSLPSIQVKRSPDPLFFFLGRLEAKKNITTLLEAWSIYSRENVGHLILAGKTVRGYSLPAVENVDLLGYVDEKEASRLFHTSTALVFPSLEEGFGFPLLQAFEAQCPVICSDIPALREVGGDAALYVDPLDATGFADAMRRLASDARLREELVARGQKRLKQFSWKKAAQALTSVFKKSDVHSS